VRECRLAAVNDLSDCFAMAETFMYASQLWGVFFAGAFAPLALFWLVAGYWQQGMELKQNTAALVLQQKELAEQVKATLQVAGHAEQQAQASS